MAGIDARFDTKAVLRAVATFAVVGIGVGLVGMVFLDRMNGDGGFFGDLVASGFYFLVVAITLLLGPVVAASVGFQSRSKSPVSEAIGSAIGYPLMMLLVIVLLSFVAQGTGSDAGESLSEWAVTILLASIPTGLVTAGTASLRSRLD